MEYRTFDNNHTPGRATETELSSSETQSNDLLNKGRAVVYLLRNQLLLHIFGEYEVRTTIATRQAWRYRCSVLRHGKEIKRDFYPIVVDRTRQMRKTAIITEEVRLQFAMEAVDMHFSRCAALQEYIKLTSLYSPPPRHGFRPRRFVLIALLCATPLLAYWLWSHLNAGDSRSVGQSRALGVISSFWNNLPPATPKQPPVKPLPRGVQWEQSQVSYELPAGSWFALLLPALSNIPEGLPVEVSLDASGQWPSWLHFARDTLTLSGKVPITEINKTFHLTFRAKTEQERDSPLQVFLTIIKQTEPLASTPRRSSGLFLGNVPPDEDCLLKILKDEPC